MLMIQEAHQKATLWRLSTVDITLVQTDLIITQFLLEGLYSNSNRRFLYTSVMRLRATSQPT